MADTAPELLTTADAVGKLPIHCAVQSCKALDVVKALVGGSPESLLIPDTEGWLPLHCVSSFASLDVVKLLTDHPSSDLALQTADEKGKLPLHHAILNRASIEILELLMNSGKGASLHFDHDGYLPLYHVLEFVDTKDHANRTAWKLGVVKMLVERSPKMLSICGPRGRLPLHYALEIGVELPILKVLLQAFPEAAKRPDGNGRLPLHCAVANQLPWESFHFILDAFPGAVCRSDKSGKIPLFIACEENAALDTVFSQMLLNPDLQIFRSSRENRAALMQES